MKILPYGDGALLIQLEQRIDKSVNEKINALNEQIKEEAVTGFLYSIPAYCSLTIVYDPFAISYADMGNLILEINRRTINASEDKSEIKIRIPVCYEEEFGLDLEELAVQKKLSKEEIILIHSSAWYHSYMVGFLPGFAYLGKVDKRLKSPRRSNPRMKVAPRTVAIAGEQTAVYPIESPGGWQLLGRSPVDIFLPELEDPFLVKSGYQVKFDPISKEEYQRIRDQVERNSFDYNSLYHVES